MKWQNCTPDNYTGTYPMLAISDGEQTYCAPASGHTEDEMVEEARKELAEDLVVVYHLSPPAASEDELRRWDGQISGRSLVSLFHEARDWHWAGWMQEINTHYADRCGERTAAPKGVLPA